MLNPDIYWLICADPAAIGFALPEFLSRMEIWMDLLNFSNQHCEKCVGANLTQENLC